MPTLAGWAQIGFRVLTYRRSRWNIDSQGGCNLQLPPWVPHPRLLQPFVARKGKSLVDVGACSILNHEIKLNLSLVWGRALHLHHLGAKCIGLAACSGSGRERCGGCHSWGCLLLLQAGLCPTVLESQHPQPLSLGQMYRDPSSCTFSKLSYNMGGT